MKGEKKRRLRQDHHDLNKKHLIKELPVKFYPLLLTLACVSASSLMAYPIEDKIKAFFAKDRSTWTVGEAQALLTTAKQAITYPRLKSGEFANRVRELEIFISAPAMPAEGPSRPTAEPAKPAPSRPAAGPAKPTKPTIDYDAVNTEITNAIYGSEKTISNYRMLKQRITDVTKDYYIEPRYLPTIQKLQKMLLENLEDAFATGKKPQKPAPTKPTPVVQPPVPSRRGEEMLDRKKLDLLLTKQALGELSAEEKQELMGLLTVKRKNLERKKNKDTGDKEILRETIALIEKIEAPAVQARPATAGQAGPSAPGVVVVPPGGRERLRPTVQKHQAELTLDELKAELAQLEANPSRTTYEENRLKELHKLIRDEEMRLKMEKRRRAMGEQD